MSKNCTSVVRAILMMVASLNSLMVCAQTGPAQRNLQVSDASRPAALGSGQYYALIIGNQNYKTLGQLQTPIHDANEIAQLLRERYRFETKVLLDADRLQILTALGEYRRTLPGNSSLLIYYAGHGYHDPDTDKAYWLPIDAESDNNANWISADDITSDVKAIPSSHILIISDSCYSGYIVGSRAANVGINPAEMHAFLTKMSASKSRNLMSSGGDEPVADTGGAGHSVFAAAILDSLQRIDEANFTASDLFQRFIQPAVGGRSAQLPQYSAIRNSGHQYGDFVFSRMAPPSEHQTVSIEQAKVIVVEHGYYHEHWNQGGGAVVHPYKVGAGGGFLTVLDPTTGLMWQRSGSGERVGHKEAFAYVEALNTRKAGGYDDWRLPTLEEAMSIMASPDRGQGGKVLGSKGVQDTLYHLDKSFEIGGAYFIWTADLESAARAWVVYFGEGICSPENLQSSAYVRAVRSNK